MQTCRDGYVPVKNGRLYVRDIGQGTPILVLHGGPDFSQSYLLPDLDRLADSFRLIYYDQRGRGRSGDGVRPEEVTIESEMDDLEEVRRHFDLESVAVMGHSWGGLLALEYATRHPERVARLIVMNGAAVSHDDVALYRESRRRTAAADLERMAALAVTAEYAAGDLDLAAAYYRLHFKTAVYRPDELEKVMTNLQSGFTPDGIRRARAIETRLYEQTVRLPGYDLVPKLKHVDVPALILHGDHDFIPAGCAERIARALPRAQYVLLEACGHFAYLERPDEVHRVIVDFFADR